jgi:hypothetical protein
MLNCEKGKGGRNEEEQLRKGADRPFVKALKLRVTEK